MCINVSKLHLNQSWCGTPDTWNLNDGRSINVRECRSRLCNWKLVAVQKKKFSLPFSSMLSNGELSNVATVSSGYQPIARNGTRVCSDDARCVGVLTTKLRRFTASSDGRQTWIPGLVGNGLYWSYCYSDDLTCDYSKGSSVVQLCRNYWEFGALECDGMFGEDDSSTNRALTTPYNCSQEVLSVWDILIASWPLERRFARTRYIGAKGNFDSTSINPYQFIAVIPSENFGKY